MLLGIIIGIVSILGIILGRKQKTVYKKMCLWMAVFSTLGILAQISQENILQDGKLERNAAGNGSKEAELIFKVEEAETEYEMTVTIPEEKLAQEEVKKLFENAEKEIEATFLGNNSSFNEVTQDVVLQDTYQNGVVQAEWQFDSYEVIEPDGKLQKEKLTEEGCLVKANCQLSYSEYQTDYQFYFNVKLPKQTKEEILLKNVKEALQKEEEQEATREFRLPKEMNGCHLFWQEKKKNIIYQFLGLGLIFSIGIRLSEEEKKRQEKQKRILLLTMEYSEIVNKLALLLGAGMTLKYAWNRIADSYEKEKSENGIGKKPAYEEMLITSREMESGVSERNAFAQFGERCGTRRYRKLASLLMQNSKKGTRGLARLLEQESEAAFEERKNMAKKYAEEAGTKLLFPMFLMLGIVIVIIMVPAVLSFQM